MLFQNRFLLFWWEQNKNVFLQWDSFQWSIMKFCTKHDFNVILTKSSTRFFRSSSWLDRPKVWSHSPSFETFLVNGLVRILSSTLSDLSGDIICQKMLIYFSLIPNHNGVQSFDFINPFPSFTEKDWWITFLLADAPYMTHWHKTCIFFSVSFFERISWMSLLDVHLWSLLQPRFTPFPSCKARAQPPVRSSVRSVCLDNLWYLANVSAPATYK